MENKESCVDPIVDVSHKPESEDKIFFGDYGSLIRVDSVSHKIAKKLKEQSESNVWFPKKFDYTKDKEGWDRLDEVTRGIFKRNISYQNLTDSGVVNEYLRLLAPIASSTIWRILYIRIGMEETVHSESYSMALDNALPDIANEVIDLVYVDKELQSRMNVEAAVAEKLERIVLVEGKRDDEAKKALLELLLVTFILEGIKFPFSFLVSFTIHNNNNNALPGITGCITDICNDEMETHVPTGKNVMNILRREKNQGFSHLFESGWFKEKARELFENAIANEDRWIESLMSDGEIPNLNTAISKNFVRYRADVLLKMLKLENDISFGGKKTDIEDWFDLYRNVDKRNVAKQESDSMGYQKGKLVNDLSVLDEEEN